MFKIIVAGSRDFTDYSFLKKTLDHLLQNITDDIEIVSGCARGADKLGERYAKEKGYKLRRMPAEWEKYGKAAGYIRNEGMARYTSPDGGCVVFRINYSPGSTHMIDLANQYGLKIRYYDF